jgi:hypothetical protein
MNQSRVAQLGNDINTALTKSVLYYTGGGGGGKRERRKGRGVTLAKLLMMSIGV